VGRVNYDPEMHMALAKEVAEATIRVYREGLAGGVGDWDNVFLNAWDPP
jgi:hypothetical protein